jgi:hypothetical protein
MGPLKPDKLDPVVLKAALKSEKHWLGGSPFFVYADSSNRVLFGQIGQDSAGEWDAYDLQADSRSLPDDSNGALYIGHFQSEKEAKRAVEEYWSTIR